MLSRTLLLATLFGLAGWTSASAKTGTFPFHTGETSRTIHPGEPRNWRGASIKALNVRLWYPIDASITEHPHNIGPVEAPLFLGPAVSLDAPLSAQRRRYPLILLSHGTGGSGDNLNWMASALAEDGYMVAAVDHPGNNALAPMTWDGFNLWWERARDISDVLDGLLSDPSLGSHIDRNRIGAIGFSLGGYTVLELAGGRTDLSAFKAFCASPEADAVCHPPEMARVANRPAAGSDASPATRDSMARSGDSYRDPRIKAVLAIAPALGQAFDPHSAAEITIPVMFIAGAADANVPPRTNAEHVAGLLNAPLSLLPQTSHYSFLPVCAPAGFEKWPSLCGESTGVDRAAIHDRAIEAARLFFSQTLR